MFLHAEMLRSLVRFGQKAWLFCSLIELKNWFSYFWLVNWQHCSHRNASSITRNSENTNNKPRVPVQTLESWAPELQRQTKHNWCIFDQPSNRHGWLAWSSKHFCRLTTQNNASPNHLAWRSSLTRKATHKYETEDVKFWILPAANNLGGMYMKNLKTKAPNPKPNQIHHGNFE